MGHTLVQYADRHGDDESTFVVAPIPDACVLLDRIVCEWFRLRKSDASTIVAIKDGVVLTKEDVAQDPQWTAWAWHIQGHEAGATILRDRLAECIIAWRRFEDVVLGRDREAMRALLVADDIRDRLQMLLLGTVTMHAQLAQQLGHILGWTSQERGTSINDGLAWTIRTYAETDAIIFDVDEIDLAREENR